MDVKISNNTISYKEYSVEPYLNLIGNTIIVFWQITDFYNKLIKNEVTSLGSALFYIDNFLENKK